MSLELLGAEDASTKKAATALIGLAGIGLGAWLWKAHRVWGGVIGGLVAGPVATIVLGAVGSKEKK